MGLPLVAIVGPTASGKSDLAMRLAERFDGEIICADSRTVYKEMDIGTAKPSKDDQKKIRHHLVDIVEPNQEFSAARFQSLAQAAIADITRRGHLPIMVGGTGLYIDSVLFNYHFGAIADPLLRKKLTGLTSTELQNVCRQKDISLPLNKDNRRHLVRAIELGGLISQEKKLRANTIVVGIATDKEMLRTRITQRMEIMIQNGVIEETEHLIKKYSRDGEALTANLYRIFGDFLEGTSTLEEAKAALVKGDLALAKRQMTWFKRNPYVLWSERPNELLKRVADYL